MDGTLYKKKKRKFFNNKITYLRILCGRSQEFQRITVLKTTLFVFQN